MITPANWERVRELFHAALDRAPEERAAFLQRESSGNEEIRREVESLLIAHPEAEHFLSRSPVPTVSGDVSPASVRLPPGTRLGAFEILGPLGAGGMGELHRALDTRLQRTVAIKVLSSDLASDPRSRDRLEREARLVSRLSHPHICTLYDVGSAAVDGHEVPFLVMELLDGETLAARLSRGPLPVEQAMKIGLEIIEALAAAHAMGIVHRDLKPANMMLTKSGVKLLDFGLARLRPVSGAAASAGMVKDDSLTIAGLVLGTLPYMAPEQVRGEEADGRTDLFAFGAVLYEMLTGTRAFNAASQPAMIAAILEREPTPVSSLQPLAPPALERLVADCLAKEPGSRWQHAQDVAFALRGIAEGRVSTGSGRAVGSDRSLPHDGRQAVARPWRLHAIWAAVAAVVALSVWSLGPARERGSAANPTPVIVLMDSPLVGRVYDPRTLQAGGTNADDVSDALRDLAVVTSKENTSAMWHREEQVRQQNPDLVVSHLSCLLDQRVANNDPAIQDHLFDVAQNRLLSFFAYLASNNSRTRFLVYSRGGKIWPTKDAEESWHRDLIGRFPHLNERLFTFLVPGKAQATFRDPATAELLRARVREILALP